MGAPKNSENLNLKYVKQLVSEVMGEELWNGFYDVVTTERPRMDMYDDGSTLTILSEIPAILSPGDVSISVCSNKLNLKGASKDKYQNNKPGTRIKSECLYGAFNRTMELPYAIDENTIKAVYENGILEITMKKFDAIETGKTISVEFKK